MLSPGVVLALLAAGFKSGKGVTTKVATERVGALAAAVGVRGYSLPWLVPILAVLGVPTLPTTPAFWGIVTVYAVGLSVVTVLTTAAYDRSDVSVVAPLLALTPAVVAVPSFVLLGEVPSPVAGSGLLLISVGAYVLNLSSLSEGVFRPVVALATDRGAQYVAGALVAFAALPSLTKVGLRSVAPPTWVFLTHLLVAAMLGGVASLWGAGRESGVTKAWGVLALFGGLNVGAWIAQTYAYTHTQVAYVQAIKRVSIVLVVVGGRVVFDEDRTAERLVGSACIVAGVTAVALGA